MAVEVFNSMHNDPILALIEEHQTRMRYVMRHAVIQYNNTIECRIFLYAKPGSEF